VVIEIKLDKDKELYISEIYNIIAELKPPSRIIVLIQHALLFFMLGVGLGLIFIMW
jgi:hypothetical protein